MDLSGQNQSDIIENYAVSSEYVGKLGQLFTFAIDCAIKT